MKLIKTLCLLFIFGCTISYAHTVDPKNRGEDRITRAKFEELWPIIVTSFWKPINNTKKAKELCWKKILKKDLALCLNDPNAEYVNSAHARQRKLLEKDVSQGVGLTVAIKQKHVFIEEVIKNMPAAISQKFQENDEIIEINGASVSRMTADSILDALYSSEKTPVIVRVRRNGGVLEPVALESISTALNSVFMQPMIHGIAYIWITEFIKRTASELRILINYLEKGDSKNNVAPVEKILFGVRGNPGGLLNSVGEICAFFADRPDTIIFTLKSQTREKVFRARDFGGTYTGIFKHYKKKVAVLINNGSASSAEIFAHCMREELEAPLVGEHSYRKGTVQTTFDLGDNDLLTITTDEYRVGKNKTRVHKIGTTPDYPIERFSSPGEPEVDMQIIVGFKILLNL